MDYKVAGSHSQSRGIPIIFIEQINQLHHHKIHEWVRSIKHIKSDEDINLWQLDK
jgi:hypothetical protein